MSVCVAHPRAIGCSCVLLLVVRVCCWLGTTRLRPHCGRHRLQKRFSTEAVACMEHHFLNVNATPRAEQIEALLQ
eukprot:SAG25_NODE_1537_length_2829_cov_1.133333_3_plen_75_part_00